MKGMPSLLIFVITLIIVLVLIFGVTSNVFASTKGVEEITYKIGDAVASIISR